MMEYVNLLLWAPVFIAGIAVGAFSATVFHRVWFAKNDRTELMVARARILASIKEENEQEILREIFQATDALNGELRKSLGGLLKALEKFLVEIRDDR